MNIDSSDGEVPATPPTQSIPSEPPPALPHGRFEGRAAFQQAVRDALLRAAHEGWREITVSDPSFEDWPLGERAVAEALQAWARPGRKWVMLASRYDEVARRHARFVAWRRTWSHLIDCRTGRGGDPVALPSCIIGPAWAMRRLDLEHCTGVCSDDPQRRVALREEVGEWLRQSGPGFPATVLGL